MVKLQLHDCDFMYQGSGGDKNEATPSTIDELPYSEAVACGGYHTCVITCNHLSLIMFYFRYYLLLSLEVKRQHQQKSS